MAVDVRIDRLVLPAGSRLRADEIAAVVQAELERRMANSTAAPAASFPGPGPQPARVQLPPQAARSSQALGDAVAGAVHGRLPP